MSTIDSAVHCSSSTFVGVSVMIVLLPFADWLNDLARKYGKEKKQQVSHAISTAGLRKER